MKRIPPLLIRAFLFCLLPTDANLVFATSVTPPTPSPENQLSVSYPDTHIAPPTIIQEAPLGSGGRDAVSRALQNAIATQPKEFPDVSQTSMTAQEIRYELAEAGEVFLTWGIDGWKPVPAAIRPAGTFIKNGGTHTPMSRQGHAFVVTLQVPTGSIIDYGFWITKTHSGQDVSIWDGNGYPARGYQTLARADHPAVVLATFDLEKAQAESNRTYAPLVTQEIRYHTGTAGEVSLVWGINGWQTIHDDVRPLGTTIQDKRMHTPMAQNGNTFVANVQVPSAAVLDYSFLITKTNGGANTKIWDAAKEYHQVAMRGGIIDITAKVASAMQGAAQSESSENSSKTSVLAQEFSYYWVHGGEILLILLAALLILALLTLLKAFVFAKKW